MADHPIDNAHVYPEDLGTDAPEDYNQPESAGHIGGLARHRTFLDYVEDGMEFSPDYGARTLDIGSGLAHLLVDDVIEIQTEPDGPYDGYWRSGMGIAIDVPEETGLPLENNRENHVFLDYHPTRGDGASYQINTTNTQPDGTYLKLGVVDTIEEEVRYAEAHDGMSGHWGRLFLAESVDDPESVINQARLEDDLGAVESDLLDEIQAVESQIFSGQWGDLTGKPSTFPPEPHTHDVSEVSGAASTSDLYTDSQARAAVDGSGVSVAHATDADNATTADSASQADDATLWAGYELVFDSETPSTSQYIRFETE